MRPAWILKTETDSMQKPTIAIIGPGRAGSALGRALHAAGYQIAAIYARRPERGQLLATELGARLTKTPEGALDLADLTILAVPDDVIAPLAADLAQAQCNGAGRAVVHLSGAQDRAALAPLKSAGLSTGVFHAVQTFKASPDTVRNIPGTLFGVDADEPLRTTLTTMATDLQGAPFDLRGVDRARYHAAAVFVANYPITLLAEARTLMQEAGVPAPTAQRALLQLLRGTLNNLNGGEPQDALTGPAVRGDAHTIQRHLAVLKDDPDLQQLYRRLADRTVTLALESGRLTQEQADAIRTTLLEAI
jgi:predicted short-subunit dehydrogenase-like oxidoreductase (DUF2520 family)